MEKEERLRQLEQELVQLKRELEDEKIQQEKLQKEELGRKITAYIEESQDENFDLYLAHMKQELEKPDSNIEEIQSSVERNLEIYKRNQQKNQGIRNAQQQGHVQSEQDIPQAEQDILQAGQSQQRAVQPRTQMLQPQQSAPQQAPQPQQSAPQQAPQPQYIQKAEKSDNNVEFKIGTWVLSIVGVAFIMAALVILGTEFLSTFVQGMLLYIVSLAVILVSEFGLRKRLEKFSLVLTGLGVSSLYIVTLINYLYLEILPSAFAIVIAAVITLAALAIGYNRDSAVIRIISILGIYMCMVPWEDNISDGQFIVFVAVIWLVNLMCLFLKASSGRMAAEIVQIVCMGIYMPFMLIRGDIEGVSELVLAIYSIAFFVMMIGIFWKMEKHAPQLWVWAVSTVLLGIFLALEYDEWLGVAVAVVLAVVSAAGCVLVRKDRKNWVLYYVLSGCLLMAVTDICDMNMDLPLRMAVMLVICLLFQMVPQLNMPKKDVLTWITLGVLGTFSLGLMTIENIWIILSCLVIGVAAILILIRERFGVAEAAKGLILACYLTYGVFCLNVEEGIIISILLMVVALAAISIGFLRKEKMMRIYGLCLALFCCLKCAVWDFWEESIFYKMIVFLVVGVLALVISLIYMMLEKNMKKTERFAQQEAEPQIETEAQREAELQREAEAQREAEPQIEAEAQREAELQREAEAQREAEPQMESEEKRKTEEAQREAELK